jgi:hypothetical protein
MICQGRRGDTSRASIVPVSFSRVSEIAVISAEMMVSTKAISPGTKRCELSAVGLKRVRPSVRIVIPSCRTPSSRWYAWITARV